MLRLAFALLALAVTLAVFAAVMTVLTHLWILASVGAGIWLISRRRGRPKPDVTKTPYQVIQGHIERK